ncbi:MAG: outer membrane lipoprotein carrier protein LolA [Crocinitomicaceae bacterium]|nr:outer membrane lipoprotein carrier protein LolA [Crocinitomicaceae bacterium]
MKSIILSTILILATSFSFGQDAKAKAILDKLSSKTKALSTVYVEFKSHIKSDAVDESGTGTAYMKGKKFFIKSGKYTLISNGVKQWVINSDEKVVYISDYEEDEDAITPNKILTIWEDDFKYKYIGTGTINGVAIEKVELYPKNPGDAQFHTIQMAIDTKNNKPVQIIVKSKDGTRMTYTFSKFEGNKEMSDSKFVFNKGNYPGYEIEED